MKALFKLNRHMMPILFFLFLLSFSCFAFDLGINNPDFPKLTAPTKTTTSEGNVTYNNTNITNNYITYNGTGNVTGSGSAGKCATWTNETELNWSECLMDGDLYLKLDQTTPQTVTAEAPVFEGGINIGSSQILGNGANMNGGGTLSVVGGGETVSIDWINRQLVAADGTTPLVDYTGSYSNGAIPISFTTGGGFSHPVFPTDIYDASSLTAMSPQNRGMHDALGSVAISFSTGTALVFNQYTTDGFLKTSGSSGTIVVDTSTYIASGDVPTYETDPIYSGNTYAIDMNQNVGTDDSVSFTSITDGTASWVSNSLGGFTSINGTTLTDGTCSISAGALTGVTTINGVNADLIKDWNSTGYIQDWNITGLLINWSDIIFSTNVFDQSLNTTDAVIFKNITTDYINVTTGNITGSGCVYIRGENSTLEVC